MVTMSSTRRDRRSAARSENRAAGVQREPVSGVWLLEGFAWEASSMYRSSADDSFGWSCLGLLAAAVAAQHKTSATTKYFIGPILRSRSSRRRAPDSFPLPAPESPCHSRDCEPGSSIL